MSEDPFLAEIVRLHAVRRAIRERHDAGGSSPEKNTHATRLFET